MARRAKANDGSASNKANLGFEAIIWLQPRSGAAVQNATDGGPGYYTTGEAS